MIVKLKKSARYRDLTFGPPYVVIGIEADEFRLLNDAGRPFWYEPSLFLVVDNRTPAEWVYRNRRLARLLAGRRTGWTSSCVLPLDASHQQRLGLGRAKFVVILPFRTLT